MEQEKKIINGLALTWSDRLGEFVYSPRPGIELQWDDPQNEREISAQKEREMFINLGFFLALGLAIVAIVNDWTASGLALASFSALARVVLGNLHEKECAARTESLAWRRQVKGVYIYSTSPEDHGVKARFDYAVSQLRINGNQYATPVTMFLFRDVCVFQAFHDARGSIQRTRVNRDEPLPAVESWEGYMVSLQKFIDNDRNVRLRSIRGSQHRDDWADAHFFKQKITVKC